MNRYAPHLPSLFFPNGMLGPIAKGILVASAIFGALGTVSTLWDNPLFVRMTPAGDWEITALLLISLLAGIFVAIRRPACSIRSAGLGGIIGFLGIACPTCNKVLMLLFGGELLLAYFEPIRFHVAAAGVLVLSAVTACEIVMRRRDSDPPAVGDEDWGS